MAQDKSYNFNALQLSPITWHGAIAHGINLSAAFSNLLQPKSNFTNWLESGEIEFNSLNISGYNFNSVHHDIEYARSVENDYYHKVGFKNELGNAVLDDSIDKLRKHPLFNEKKEIFYVFRISDLNHFVSLYFQHWLLFNTFYYWSRWQLYFDFIVKQSTEINAQLYQYMWTCIFGRIEGYTYCFENVDQYKLFRDKYEEIEKLSLPIQDEYVRARDSKSDKRMKSNDSGD